MLHREVERYCRMGGFPEVQLFDANRRLEILQSYVDAVVLRDVLERHRVANVEALRALVYQVLRNPAAKLSVNRFYLDLKSRGFRIGKDDLYAFLRHPEDAFLLFSVPIWSRSEKKRQVNPKKVYVIDNGILDAYSTNLTADRGAFLENLVFLTLRQRGFDVSYYVTKGGREVDFIYRHKEQTFLVQVAWTLEIKSTRQREFQALEDGKAELGKATCMVVTINEEWMDEASNIAVVPLWKYLTE